MRRKRVHLWALNGLEQIRALGSITACCALGMIAGCWCSAFLEREGASALRTWLEGYVSLSRSGGAGGAWYSVLWQTLRTPLLLTLLQFTVLGMLLIPLVLGVRGFLLAFAVTGFVRTYAWRGLAAAALLFAPLGAVELSALFVLSTAAFLRADELGRERGSTMSVGASGWVMALCWVVLALTAAVQVLLSGTIARALGAFLGG